MEDLISRQAAIDIFDDYNVSVENGELEAYSRNRKRLCNLPPAQPEPSEITDEQAILHLQSTGWMQNHDREMYESGLKEQLADDSGSYDSLVPYEDAISRQVAIDAIDKWKNDFKGYVNALNIPRDDYNGIMAYIDELPSAQPEIVRCKDCKHLFNKDDLGGKCWHFNGFSKVVSYDDFCSRAERRTDE